MCRVAQILLRKREELIVYILDNGLLVREGGCGSLYLPELWFRVFSDFQDRLKNDFQRCSSTYCTGYSVVYRYIEWWRY